MSQQVQFRRIGGRIVPIKQKQSSNGGKTVAAGLGIAGVSGVIAGKLDHHGSMAHLKSFNEFAQREFKFKTPFSQAAARSRAEGMRAHAAARRIKGGGALIGSALVGAGVNKILNKTDLDEPTKKGIATGSGVGAYFAVRAAHLKVFGRMTTRGAVAEAFKRILIRGTRL